MIAAKELVKTLHAQETEESKEEEKRRHIEIDDHKNVYATGWGKYVTSKPDTGHSLLLKTSKEQNLKTAWENWKSHIDTTIPALNSRLSNPKLKIYYDITKDIQEENFDLFYKGYTMNWQCFIKGRLVRTRTQLTQQEYSDMLDRVTHPLKNLEKSDTTWYFFEKENESMSNKKTVLFGKTSSQAALIYMRLRYPDKSIEQLKLSTLNFLEKNIALSLDEKTSYQEDMDLLI
jgi:hypothetical protein